MWLADVAQRRGRMMNNPMAEDVPLSRRTVGISIIESASSSKDYFQIVTIVAYRIKLQ